MTMIPQANPGAGYRALKPEIDAAVARALSSGWYILGSELCAFEAARPGHRTRLHRRDGIPHRRSHGRRYRDDWCDSIADRY
jgi:hypothetical protein